MEIAAICCTHNNNASTRPQSAVGCVISDVVDSKAEDSASFGRYMSSLRQMVLHRRRLLEQSPRSEPLEHVPSNDELVKGVESTVS